jgi:hypothetical protein
VEDAAEAAGAVALGLGEAEARRHEGIVVRAAEMGKNGDGVLLALPCANAYAV